MRKITNFAMMVLGLVLSAHAWADNHSVSIAPSDDRAGNLPKIEKDAALDDSRCASSCGDEESVGLDDNHERVVMSLTVFFDANRAEVKENDYDDIGKLADFLKEFPDKQVVIEGYADSVGDENYNRKLSEKRAESVRRVLIEKFGIDARRITAVGYGEDNPLAPNDTAEGRRKNRRAEAFVEAIRTK